MKKVLVDTQVFLWWVWDAPHLSARANALLRNPDHELYLSLASAWEIAIKVSTGKLQLTESVEKFIGKRH